jgi:glycerol-3-phosphate O-acyltransferase/dihydroxyacetone phosphate acyltransferase
MLLYRLLRAFLRLLSTVFYRQIEVVGREHIPERGPVIFAGNHPNSLHDPMLIIAFAGRVVHFAAKDVLFKSRFLRFFLTNLGAVPIARRSDHGGADQVDNQGAFTALVSILAEGRAMGIFPEGLSHDEAQLARLKTGAARISFQLLEAHPELTVNIVPCGLTYVHPKRFRSRVLLQFGPPIAVDRSRIAGPEGDPREAAQTLTAQIEQALRALTVNADDWDTLRVLDGVRRLYQPPQITLEQRIELARRFNAVYPTVKDQPEVKAIVERVGSYLDRLQLAGLEDRDLRREMSPLEIAFRAISHAVLLLVWLPLALPGIAVFIPLLLTVRILGPRVSPRRDVIATTKLVIGMLSTFGLMGLITAAVTLKQGAAAGVLTAALLFVSFHATLRVLERGRALRRLASTSLRALALGQEIRALRAERGELARLVAEAVDRFRPADMAPMFVEPPLLEASDNLS